MDEINQSFYDQLSQYELEWNEFQGLLASVEVMSDNKLYLHYLNKQKNIDAVVSGFKEYKKLAAEINDFNELALLSYDHEKAQIHENVKTLTEKQNELWENLKRKLRGLGVECLQKVIIELKQKNADEFAKDLKEVILNFAKHSKFEVVKNEDEEIILSGLNVYNILKCFSGKIQKIQKGQVQEVLMVVLEKSQCDVEFNIDDVEFQTSKSGGAGGQHINKTESAVKLIHVPTGITVSCQDDRSQTKNKERAIELLVEKIAEYNAKNSKKHIENQRKILQNAIFSSTPVIVFDYDKNVVVSTKTKTTYEIDKILSGELDLISNDMSVR